MLAIQIVLYDGFDLLDAIAPYEVFCAAEMIAGGGLCVEFVTAEGPRPVPSGVNGLNIEASGRLAPDRKGIIVVPGASGEVEGDGPNAIPAILARAMNTTLTEMLKQALSLPDVVVATVCGGSLVLGMGGLLDGRPAVTNHLGMGLLGATGAVPVTARVVDDGNLVTGGGVTSGLDVALHLVERELGPHIAHAVEQLFEFERRGTVWRSKGIAPRMHWGAAAAVPDLNTALESAQSQVINDAQVPDFDGDWETTIATPVGKLAVKLHIETVDGVIRGRAVQGQEAVAFLHPHLTGNILRWSQQITKPMRLNLRFEAAVEGDRMTGLVKAGLLPASKLTGKRISE